MVLIKRNKEWAKENKEHLNEYSRNWRKKNPERSRMIKQRYADKLKKKRKEIREIKEKNKYF